MTAAKGQIHIIYLDVYATVLLKNKLNTFVIKYLVTLIFMFAHQRRIISFCDIFKQDMIMYMGVDKATFS